VVKQAPVSDVTFQVVESVIELPLAPGCFAVKYTAAPDEVASTNELASKWNCEARLLAIEAPLLPKGSDFVSPPTVT
jgi:hypothetical protein